MRERIILENTLNSNFRLYLYIFTLFTLVFPLAIIVMFNGFLRLVGVLGLVIILFFAISIWFLKKGFIKTERSVEIGYFSWGYLIFSVGFGEKNEPIISLLKFKKRERAAFRSIANPEFSESFNSFSLYLLNAKHTKKTEIISFKKESNAELALEFILKHTKYKREIYSPDFS